MIDKCTLAISNCIDKEGFNDHDLYMIGQKGYEKIGKSLVISVIKAMREPTEKMSMKGNLAIAAGLEADDVFKNMIDCIVND